MASEPPIACTLSATELSQRLAQMRALGRVALLGIDRQPALAEVRFRADAGTRARLQAIVAAEARCCAFLRMTLHDDSEAIALRISAPPGAEPVIDDLIAAFAGRQ